MHQTVYGTLNLNPNLKVNIEKDYQPIATYSASGTLFTIGAQFEGNKNGNEFKFTKISLKIYCFFGAITYGFIENGISFEQDIVEEDGKHKEHILKIKVQALNTTQFLNWQANSLTEDSNFRHWEILPDQNYKLKDDYILRTEIQIVPVIIEDIENKNAQDVPFIDDFKYIRDGEKIIDKENFTEVLLDRDKAVIFGPMWQMDVFSNYFLKGRDKNCYQRDVRIKLLE